ncbi:hypothetical protein BKA93DRAFT_471896 [Sparassis latifolia]
MVDHAIFTVNMFFEVPRRVCDAVSSCPVHSQGCLYLLSHRLSAAWSDLISSLINRSILARTRGVHHGKGPGYLFSRAVHLDYQSSWIPILIFRTHIVRLDRNARLAQNVSLDQNSRETNALGWHVPDAVFDGGRLHLDVPRGSSSNYFRAPVFSATGRLAKGPSLRLSAMKAEYPSRTRARGSRYKVQLDDGQKSSTRILFIIHTSSHNTHYQLNLNKMMFPSTLSLAAVLAACSVAFASPAGASTTTVTFIKSINTVAYDTTTTVTATSYATSTVPRTTTFTSTTTTTTVTPTTTTTYVII